MQQSPQLEARCFPCQQHIMQTQYTPPDPFNKIMGDPIPTFQPMANIDDDHLWISHIRNSVVAWVAEDLEASTRRASQRRRTPGSTMK